ncbi:MAG: tripartite tricarboxylate transporter substrate binding protein [Betaproteobacteria bacterium]|nr:tripartite tricarboxylate transporter substrate binding protein [Betaproteobacteria bacterium]
MKLSLGVIAALMLFAPSLSVAQGRLVKIVVPYAPGGNVDVIARLYAKKSAELLKENWIVENQSGGSGTIGTNAVARAAPDGATLLFAPDAHTIVRLVVKNVPYDPLKDFVPIARVAEAPLMFIVNPTLVRARNLTELAAEVSANPRQYSFAISGLGTSPHLGAEAFRLRVAKDILIVPYRGTGPAVKDVAGGQVSMMVVAPLAAMPLVRGGRLRALAVTAPNRFEGLPEVPTTEEAGMKDFVFMNSYGLWGPKGLPDEQVARINGVMRQASESPDIRRRLLDLGVTAIWETPQAFAKHALAEYQTNSRIYQQAGVKPE